MTIEGQYGRVGIGSTIPQKRLTIRNGSGDDGGILVQPNINFAANENRAYLVVGTDAWSGLTTSWNTYGFQHRFKTNSGGSPRLTIDSASGELLCIENGGNIGIGTDNPLRPLHIEASDCRIRLTDSDVTTDVELQNNSGDAILTTNGASNLSLQTNNTERLRITSDGKVGINTNSGLKAPLHVAHADGGFGATPYNKAAIFGSKGWVDDTRYHYNDATIFLSGRNNAGIDTGAGIEFTTRTVADNNWRHGAITFGQDGIFRVLNGGAGTTEGTEKVSILTNGNVGIGSTTPTLGLDINRGANSGVFLGNPIHGYKIRANATSSNDYGLLIEDEDGVDLYRAVASTGTSNANTHTWWTDTEERFQITSGGVKQIKNGNLNILSTYIDFSGSLSSTPATAAAIFRPADNTLAFSTANEERLRIASDGKVGIGTTNPRSTYLHVGPVGNTPGSVFTTSPLSVFASGNLGGTTGDDNKIAIFGGQSTGNVSGLSLYHYRRSTGTSWTTDGFSFRQEVDNTADIHNYMCFAGGKVGIGTAIPGEKLHVIGQVGGSNPSAGSKWDIARFVAHDYSATNSGGLTIGAYWNNSTVSGRRSYIQSSQSTDSGSTARDLLLNPDGGDVGIGTDQFYDGSTKLEVRGRINTVGSASTGSINPGNGTVVNVGSLTNHNLQLITGNSTRVTIVQAGTSGEAMRISGVGVTVQSSLTPNFEVQTTASSGQDCKITLKGARTSSSTSNIAMIRFVNDTSSSYTMGEIVGMDPAGAHASQIGDLVFRTTHNDTTTEVARFTGGATAAGRNLKFADGSGIDFSATTNSPGANSDTTSEVLNDYERGTFDFKLDDDDAGSDTLKMHYVKVGSIVHCYGPFRGTEGQSASVYWQLSGTANSNITTSCELPFVPVDSGACDSPIYRNIETREPKNPSDGELMPVLGWAAGDSTCRLTDTRTEKVYNAYAAGDTMQKADTRTNVVLHFNFCYVTNS